jgi:hypothetical protein
MAEGPPDGGGGSAEDRDLERSAIIGLALSTLPNENEVRDKWIEHGVGTIPTAPEAIRQLAQLTEQKKRRSPRAVTLRLLAKSGRRRGTQHLAGCEHALASFLQHDCDHDPEQQVQAVFDGLEATAHGRDRSWIEFARVTSDALGMTDEEVALPLCNDDEVVTIDGQKAYRVATWFWSPLPPSAFQRWTDPRHWAHDNSLFFEDVSPVTPLDDDRRYSTLFQEQVRFTPTKLLRTPLVFTRVVDDPEHSSVFFDLPRGQDGQPETTSDIAVDVGSVIVQGNPGGDPKRRTRLSAEKCILFKDPAMAAWPTVACDLFWMEFTISAALSASEAADDPGGAT